MRRVGVLLSIGMVFLLVGQAAAADAKAQKVEGYAEYRRGEILVVDGQRIRTNASTKFKGTRAVMHPEQIPLGFQVTAKGSRKPDGSLLAAEMETKPNGIEAFQNQVLAMTNDMEKRWVSAGLVFHELSPGKTEEIGRLYRDGADVDRVRAISARLVPPYLNPENFRIYVVDNKEWNAFACANGMIVIHNALLRDLDDDEVAVVLGHELVHATHEHTRKEFKRGMWLQLIVLGLELGTEAMGDNKENARAAIELIGALSVMAWKSSYSRELEDQADRVGLRYVHEAGYDARVAPTLWKRFADKYGSSNRAVNFFFGDHSLPKARAANLEREIELNYTPRP